ncbi:MAG TPA: DUF1552 domain-containing protein [Planctomycetaceae bacterium]|jgi:hypothetical protein|nr:DUF1552 domain-containing protein [Planctomycetaceae bacterium]
MKQKSWHLSRRELLKGGGIALALPFLDSMAWAKGAENIAMPKRMVISYFSYGAYMPNGANGIQDMNKPAHEWTWWPCQEAGELTFNKNSAPFAPLKDQVSYLEGLDHEGGWSLGGHSSGDVFATGADMKEHEKTNNISVDQAAAKVMGHHTRYASLVMSSEGGTGSYGASKTLSHYGPGRPIPSLHKPQDIFNRLFKPYAGKTTDQVRSELSREKSVLDLILSQYKSLNNRLGTADQAKMEEYLESVRALEKRVDRTTAWTHTPLAKVNANEFNLEVSYKDPQEYLRCMYDLMFVALQTDSTRVATFQTESENSSQSELWNFATYALGYKGATHDIAHKRPADYSGQWDLWRNQQHAYFLNRLRTTKEGDSNMLDNTVVLWGCGHPHASHSTHNYPIQLAGGRNLGFKHGKLHKFVGDKKVPLSNLFVSMLNSVDVPTESFADSTGEMKELRS